jgi:hypothetical protein
MMLMLLLNKKKVIIYLPYNDARSQVALQRQKGFGNVMRSMYVLNSRLDSSLYFELSKVCYASGTTLQHSKSLS